MFIRSAEEFATSFNMKYPGVYRGITVQDVRDMTKCHLIGRYDYYLRDDLEIIRGMLQYEQLREKRSAQRTEEEQQLQLTCKRCRQPLPPEPEGKKGRPREYCSSCELLRNRERYRKWRKRKRRLENKSPSGSA